jgi:hypothetical protein
VGLRGVPGDGRARIERRVAEVVSREYAVVTASGTVALYCALRALGVAEGHEVVLPSIVCPAILTAVLAAGGRPVFCDVSSTDLNMDPESLRRVMTGNTRVVIPVHSFGVPCELRSISSVAHRKGVAVLEDAAQAFGNTGPQGPLGSLGCVSITSFGREKLLDAGGGGALFTDDPSLHREALRALSLFPQIQASSLFRAAGRIQSALFANLPYSTRWAHKLFVATAERSWPPNGPMPEPLMLSRIAKLISVGGEYRARRLSRSHEVARRTADIGHLRSFAGGDRILTMATFLLPERPSIRRMLLARSRGLFFMYRPLHLIYGVDPDLPFSQELDGRLVNISLSPSRDISYLDSAIAALKMCAGRCANA